MKHKLILFITLLTLFSSKVLMAQDFWVKKLPDNGFCEFMLEVDDGYVLVAQVEDSENVFTLTIYKYSKTGEMLWRKRYFEGEHRFVSDFIKTSDGGFLVVFVCCQAMKIDQNGEIDFMFDPELNLLDTLGNPRPQYFNKGFELQDEEVYGILLNALGAHEDAKWKYPVTFDKFGNLLNIDTLHANVGYAEYNKTSIENTDNYELFISNGLDEIYYPLPNYSANYFSVYPLPVQAKTYWVTLSSF